MIFNCGVLLIKRNYTPHVMQQGVRVRVSESVSGCESAECVREWVSGGEYTYNRGFKEILKKGIQLDRQPF